MFRHPKPDPVEPGQESVWDYPRPPRLEPTSRRIRVVFGGEEIANTTKALRMLETSHPPTYYLPPEDVRSEFFVPVSGGSFCEFKGRANYYDIVVGDKRAPRAAWSYENPTQKYKALDGYLAFYIKLMDACYVDEEQAQPQPGDFYGGWITSDLAGPFKGVPGSMFW